MDQESVYSDVVFRDREGGLILSQDGIAFRSKDDDEQGGCLVFKVPWSVIKKHQVCPHTDGEESCLKISITNAAIGKGQDDETTVFRLPSSKNLDLLGHDINEHCRKHPHNEESSESASGWGTASMTETSSFCTSCESVMVSPKSTRDADNDRPLMFMVVEHLRRKEEVRLQQQKNRSAAQPSTLAAAKEAEAENGDFDDQISLADWSTEVEPHCSFRTLASTSIREPSILAASPQRKPSADAKAAPEPFSVPHQRPSLRRMSAESKKTKQEPMLASGGSASPPSATTVQEPSLLAVLNPNVLGSNNAKKCLPSPRSSDTQEACAVQVRPPTKEQSKKKDQSIAAIASIASTGRTDPNGATRTSNEADQNQSHETLKQQVLVLLGQDAGQDSRVKPGAYHIQDSKPAATEVPASGGSQYAQAQTTELYDSEQVSEQHLIEAYLVCENRLRAPEAPTTSLPILEEQQKEEASTETKQAPNFWELSEADFLDVLQEVMLSKCTEAIPAEEVVAAALGEETTSEPSATVEAASSLSGAQNSRTQTAPAQPAAEAPTAQCMERATQPEPPTKTPPPTDDGGGCCGCF